MRWTEIKSASHLLVGLDGLQLKLQNKEILKANNFERSPYLFGVEFKEYHNNSKHLVFYFGSKKYEFFKPKYVVSESVDENAFEMLVRVNTVNGFVHIRVFPGTRTVYHEGNEELQDVSRVWIPFTDDYYPPWLKSISIKGKIRTHFLYPNKSLALQTRFQRQYMNWLQKELTEHNEF